MDDSGKSTPKTMAIALRSGKFCSGKKQNQANKAPRGATPIATLVADCGSGLF